VAASIGVAACAGGPREDVVARVGDANITNAGLAHIMAVLAPRHRVPRPPSFSTCVARRKGLTLNPGAAEAKAECEREYQTLKREALSSLIATRWLIGEAADQGLSVSDREVRRELNRRERMFAQQGTDFTAVLRATDQTLVDVELEIRAELAKAKLREALRHRESLITHAELTAYYRGHIHQFARRERRSFYIVEDLSSRAAAEQRRREILHGRRIASFSLHESMERSDHPLSSPAIVKAIFTARPGALVGPITVGREQNYLLEVDSITPPTRETLAEASRAIETQLRRERQRRALAAFVKAATAKWVARTSCSPGYVVGRCRQYAGPRTSEDAFDLA
jgi:parvulin-like peptidyl-prolyl cis-trans isomerase-like protein/SurA-like protein